MRKTNRSGLMAALLMMSSSWAVAETPPQPDRGIPLWDRWVMDYRARQAEREALPTIGDATEAALAQQVTGATASANPQAATRELREKAAERFLKTYDQPLPASVYGDSFATGSGN